MSYICQRCCQTWEADYCHFCTPKTEKVNNGGSSSYYHIPPNCKNLQDIIVEKDMCYTRGNIFKAAYRWGEKGVSDDPLENKIYNLEKIIWFAQDMLDRIHASDPSNPRSANYEHRPESTRED